MRWDRKNRPILFRVLHSLGWPIFWLLYSVMILPMKVGQGIRWSIQKCRFFYRVSRAILTNPTRMMTSRIKPSNRWQAKTAALVAVSILSGLLLIGGGCFYWYVLRDLPQPQTLLSRQQAVTTKIYDRNGGLLYKIYKNQNRTIIPLAEIPPQMIQATLAIEDAGFFNHPGFSAKGILRALSTNFRNENTSQGGSTITQQLVKNALLSSEKTLLRKVRELVLAMEVEYFFTKDEILSMYFNEVPYGGTAYGVEEASWQYLGKSVRDVNLAEAALLAGLPQSPTVYSPFGAQPEAAIARQHQVLKRMVEERMITDAEAQAAIETPLVFAQPKTDIVSPHFVMFVKDYLAKQYGDTLMQSGGLEVTTTLDSRIQQLTEAAVTQELDRLKSIRVSNGAALVIRPSTGEILAMVGSRNYFDTAHDGQVNVTIRLRQPGSSIKPLTYALALQQHLITPATLIEDAPVAYQIAGSPVYAPQNYDGRFHGNVTVRQALANSYNIPAVKTLAQVGVMNLVDFAGKMGITTWTNPSRFGLSLTLGGGEVKMTDMAVAYGVFANGGQKVPLTPLLRVSDYSGKRHDSFICGQSSVAGQVLAAEPAPCQPEQVIDPGVAYLISSILADNQARSAAFGLHSVLAIPNQQVAVKTGTTNDLRDNWTFGYTKDYLVATWVGNNDNSPMSKVASGITGASPIWQTIMKGLYQDQPTHVFTPPDSVIQVPVCPATQSLNCGACSNSLNEYFLRGTEPKNRCTEQDVLKTLNPTPPAIIRDRILDGATHQRPLPTPKSKRQPQKNRN